MRVTVEPEKCVGAGQCVHFAPNVFDQKLEDGVVVLLEPNPPADQWDAVDQAADVCPSLAILVDRD